MHPEIDRHIISKIILTVIGLHPVVDKLVIHVIKGIFDDE